MQTSARSPLRDGFTVNEIRVTPADGELWQGEQRLGVLPPKAMEVLVTLAEHANEVVSRDDLMAAVWPDRVISDDTLTAYLSEIRRALGDDAKSQSILETISKRGYRLRGDVRVAPKPLAAPGERQRRWKLGAALVAVVAVAVLAVRLFIPSQGSSLVVMDLVHDAEAKTVVVEAAERYTQALRDRLNDLEGIRVTRGIQGTAPREIAEQDGSFVVSGSIEADSAIDARLALVVTATKEMSDLLTYLEQL